MLNDSFRLSWSVVMSVTNVIGRAVVLLIMLMTFASGAGTQTQDSQMLFSSSMIKACMVAYDDFKSKISSQPVGSAELVAHVSNIDNYSVSVGEDAANYVVTFLPDPYLGQVLKGGGARYVIDKASAEIKDVMRFK